jgi:hypothetical protein
VRSFRRLACISCRANGVSRKHDRFHRRGNSGSVCLFGLHFLLHNLPIISYACVWVCVLVLLPQSFGFFAGGVAVITVASHQQPSLSRGEYGELKVRERKLSSFLRPVSPCSVVVTGTTPFHDSSRILLWLVGGAGGVHVPH